MPPRSRGPERKVGNYGLRWVLKAMMNDIPLCGFGLALEGTERTRDVCM